MYMDMFIVLCYVLSQKLWILQFYTKSNTFSRKAALYNHIQFGQPILQYDSMFQYVLYYWWAIKVAFIVIVLLSCAPKWGNLIWVSV